MSVLDADEDRSPLLRRTQVGSPGAPPCHAATLRSTGSQDAVDRNGVDHAAGPCSGGLMRLWETEVLWCAAHGEPMLERQRAMRARRARAEAYLRERRQRVELARAEERRREQQRAEEARAVALARRRERWRQAARQGLATRRRNQVIRDWWPDLRGYA